MHQNNEKIKRGAIAATILAVVAIAVYILFFRGPKPEYGEAGVVFVKTGDIVQSFTPKNEAASVKGLGGRTVLPEDYGMLWHFNPAQKPTFTMRGMRIPLDFIWIKDSQVVEITARVPITETQIIPKNYITEVLEVGAGYAAKHGVSVGDKLEIIDSAWSN